MIVRTIESLHGTEREVHAPTWVSRRLLLRKDGMGFSLHETVLRAGTETRMHYKHHLEAVLCIEGTGALTDLGTGERHAIAPGTMYALDRHDRHVLEATTDLRMLCVFNPPCTGNEVHLEDGSYPLMPDDGQPSPSAA